MRFLVWVRYRSDADRKRVESVVERFSDKLRFVKTGGVVYVVEAVDEGVARAFIEELYAKLGGVVRAYKLSDLEYVPKLERERISYSFNTSVERVWGYIEAFMARYRGVLVSETKRGRRYSVYVRGEGEVSVDTSVFERGGEAIASFEFEGYGRAPATLRDRVDEYMRLLGGRVVG